VHSPQTILLEDETTELLFRKILGSITQARDAMAVVRESVAHYPLTMRRALYQAHAEGYRDWLLAGLPPQTPSLLREMAEADPDPVAAIHRYIEAAR
jgi:hypothetical protein